MDEFPIERGYVYRKGDVVLLQIADSLSPRMQALMQEQLTPLKEKHGIEFVLLGPQIKVVDPDTPAIDTP